MELHSKEEDWLLQIRPGGRVAMTSSQAIYVDDGYELVDFVGSADGTYSAQRISERAVDEGVPCCTQALYQIRVDGCEVQRIIDRASFTSNC